MSLLPVDNVHNIQITFYFIAKLIHNFALLSTFRVHKFFVFSFFQSQHENQKYKIYKNHLLGCNLMVSS